MIANVRVKVYIKKIKDDKFESSHARQLPGVLEKRRHTAKNRNKKE
jgi:hypothetical protein